MTTEISSQVAPLHSQRPTATERPPLREAVPASPQSTSGVSAGPSPAQLAERNKAIAETVQASGNNGAVDEAGLSAVVKDLNQLIQVVQRELQFSVDAETNRTVVKVVDSETDEVIRQIPSDEVLALIRHLQESRQGGLFQEQA